MAKLDKILKQMRNTPKNVSYSDLCFVCDHHFGSPRQSGTSHRFYKTPWQGQPLVNIQADGKNAKAYQVKQVLDAIKKLEDSSG